MILPSILVNDRAIGKLSTLPPLQPPAPGTPASPQRAAAQRAARAGTCLWADIVKVCFCQLPLHHYNPPATPLSFSICSI
jgi:hypothetical protein